MVAVDDGAAVASAAGDVAVVVDSTFDNGQAPATTTGVAELFVSAASFFALPFLLGLMSDVTSS